MGITAGTAATIAGIAGATAAVGGAGMSYAASRNASQAAANAQNQSLQAQNQAFQARMQAQNQQTTEQAGIQDQSQQAYEQAEQQMRQGQSQALQDQATQVAKMNQQEQAIQGQTQQAVQQTTQQAVTPASLQQAQAASEQARVAGVQPTVEDIRATNPLPSSNEGSATQSAMAKAMSDAADYTARYGQNLARLGSYSAPMQAVDVARTNLATQLMPQAAADQLLKSGVAARLLPSQTAYQGATTLGNAAIDANTMTTNQRMQLAATRAQYAENLADLGQTDTNAAIQTGLNVTQARDAATSSLGQGLGALGNAAIGYSASKGAFANLFGGGGGMPIVSGTLDPYADVASPSYQGETPAIPKYNIG